MRFFVLYIEEGIHSLLEKLEMLEKLENEPFSEFDWKSWKAIGFSPALAGKAGILFLGLIIISSIIK